jgi:hypothetical protein
VCFLRVQVAREQYTSGETLERRNPILFISLEAFKKCFSRKAEKTRI